MYLNWYMRRLLSKLFAFARRRKPAAQHTTSAAPNLENDAAQILSDVITNSPGRTHGKYGVDFGALRMEYINSRASGTEVAEAQKAILAKIREAMGKKSGQ